MTNNKNIQIPYGLDIESEKLIHINKAVNGIKCNCVCPGCGQLLEACNGGNQTRNYFRHHNSQACNEAYNGMLHKLVEELIEKEKKLCIPDMQGGDCVIKFEKVEREKYYKKFIPILQKYKQNKTFQNKKYYKEFIPDIVAYDKYETPYFIEVYVTHKCEEEKIKKLEKTNVTTFEIDIPTDIDINIDLNKIKKNLFESSKWIEIISTPFGLYNQNKNLNYLNKNLKVKIKKLNLNIHLHKKRSNIWKNQFRLVNIVKDRYLENIKQMNATIAHYRHRNRELKEKLKGKEKSMEIKYIPNYSKSEMINYQEKINQLQQEYIGLSDFREKIKELKFEQVCLEAKNQRLRDENKKIQISNKSHNKYPSTNKKVLK